jgi:SSS family solute:Na+ symporter
VYQFVILFIGFIITMFFCVPELVSSWGHITEKLPDTFLELTGGKGWLFLITTFLAFILGEEFSPAYATRYCAGEDVRQTKLGIAGAGVFLAFTFPVIIFFIALYAKVNFPDLAKDNYALPMVISKLNNPVIGGLIIGAILMAVMSSADSVLNSATTIFVKDLFEHMVGWQDKGDGKMLKIARICSIAIGAGAILIAVLWSDIIGLLLLTYDVWAPAIILPVCVGALSKWKSRELTRNIFITMLVSTFASLAYRLVIVASNRWDWKPFSDSVYAFMGKFNTAVFGVTVSCVLFLILSLIFRSRDEDNIEPVKE